MSFQETSKALNYLLHTIDQTLGYFQGVGQGILATVLIILIHQFTGFQNVTLEEDFLNCAIVGCSLCFLGYLLHRKKRSVLNE